jgi:F0F1-type ATP synthase membrane subunit b/b'
MRKNHALISGVLTAMLLCGGAALAQTKKPVENVSSKRHPNIAAAQRLTEQAFNKITAAQQANEFDMDGHAKKAKEALDEANRELKAAAEAANKGGK